MTIHDSNFSVQDPNYEVKNKKKRGRPRLLTTKRERSETKNAHVSKSKSKWTLKAVEAINKSEARDAIQCCREISLFLKC